MKNVLQFCLDNWQFIAYVLISVISSVLVLILKKKKVINEMDNILKDILDSLPGFISSAESLIGSGYGGIKKQMVLDFVKEYVKKQFSINLPDSYIPYIESQIEAILKTPQKKKEGI